MTAEEDCVTWLKALKGFGFVWFCYFFLILMLQSDFHLIAAGVLNRCLV